LDDDDEDSSYDEDERWSEVNKEVNVQHKKSASIEQEGGGKLDEIGEVGNVEK
jgi:hypothetical protein